MNVLKDAFIISLFASIEAVLACLLVSALAKRAKLGKARGLFALNVFVGMSAGVALVLYRHLPVAAIILPWLDKSRFFLSLFLLGAGLAMRRHYAPVDARPGDNGSMRTALRIILPFTGLLWLVSEAAALTTTLGGLVVLTGRQAGICLAAACGFAAAAAAGAAVEGIANRLKPPPAITPAALMFLLFALKVVGVATWGTGAKSLAMWIIYFVDNTIHDSFHIFFVMFQLPDHPFLKDEVYQDILYFFNPIVHAVTAALALSALVAAAWLFFLRRPPVPVPESTRAPGRRLIRAATRGANARACAVFIVVIVFVWFGILYENSKNDAFYNPAPIPVVADGNGIISAPLGGPFDSADDTKLRKYVYSDEKYTITFLSIKRPDGTVAVALDMCEICRPKGYAQTSGEYVICIYCMTPIPISTVGQPGGCNPIPIPGTAVDGRMLRIPRKLLVDAYRKRMEDKR